MRHNLRAPLLVGILCLAAAVYGAETDYFPDGYLTSRATFRQLAEAIRQADSRAELGALPVPSPTDGDLTIDYLYLPASGDPQKIFVLTSGVHGVEAFAGSAVQSVFLREVLPKIARERLGILLVHALNPYGFKYHRRVTENNVDLNRNFSDSPELFASVNPGYRKLAGFLNPTGPATVLDPRYWWRELQAVRQKVMPDIAAAREATLLGQYEMPQGIYFGGRRSEPNEILVDRLLAEKTAAYREAYLIDLHTGYGARGIQHFWGNSAPGARAAAAERVVYAGYPIERAEQNTFYKISGDFAEYFSKRYSDRIGLAMSFEYGTLNTQTLAGSLDALYRVKLENQGHHHGYTDSVSERAIHYLFLEGYAPSAREWRRQVIAQARESLPRILSRIESYRENE